MIFRSLFFIFLIGFILEINGQESNSTLRSQFDDESLNSSPQGVFYSDIWGYAADNGREYAIIGAASTTIFVDVTNPDSLVESSRIASSKNCTWRDYKTYGHYAYGVADNCSAGLQIFDLSNLPTEVTKVYDSRSLIDNAHNIFIDTSTAKLYACGVNHATDDIIVLDLSVNPDDPTLLSSIDLNLEGENDYIHDLYVRNDTAYLCNGSESRMLIYNLTDIANPIFLGAVNSTGYNHSTWISDNGKVAVVADETHGRPLRVVDITNIDIPQEMSTIKSTLLAPDHTNSLAHNPFILGNDFAVISYYEDGLQIYKIDSTHKPFRAGFYDTRPGENNYSGFNGAWGAYPFLPSGNILVSDVDNGLFVITPQFPLWDCQEDVMVSGIYDHHWDLISKDNMSLSATYQDSATVRLYAPDQIILDNGFEITAGSILEAQIIDKCTSPSSLKLSKLQKPNK